MPTFTFTTTDRTLITTASGLNGYTIDNFLPGDVIDVTDDPSTNLKLTIVNGTNTLDYSDTNNDQFSFTIANLGPGRIFVYPNGTGSEIVLREDAHNDFNGDGSSDILWRNDSGYLTEWTGTSNGGFVSNEVNAGTGAADNSWQVAGTGDFNGDGRVDILWRNTTSGYITEWLSTANGGFTSNEANAGTGAADNSWQVAGIGDFNGDGHSDILWRNTTSGYVTEWLGTANGGFTSNQANAGTGAADNSWQIVGTGDFNGDGYSDILWRNSSGYLTEWLGTSTGGFTDNGGTAGNGSADNSWQVVGTGDFNGDGTSDILWRNTTTGYLTEWLGSSSGAFTSNNANAGTGAADTSWHVVSIGDFNHDGIDDILWRNTSGYVTEWVGTANGGFLSNEANAGTGMADTSWHVQDPFLAG